MELEKIRNLGPDELQHEEQQASEQLFRLRFQMRLGQTEGVKKLRGLKKDIARIKTIARERELGLNTAVHTHAAVAPARAKKKTAAKGGKRRAVKKTAAKKMVKQKSAPRNTAAGKASKKTKKKEAR